MAHVCSFNISGEQLRALNAIAASKNLSRPALLRLLISDAIEKHAND